MKLNGQLHRAAVFPPGKTPANDLRGHFGKEKISSLAVIRTLGRWARGLVNTDYDIPALKGNNWTNNTCRTCPGTLLLLLLLLLSLPPPALQFVSSNFWSSQLLICCVLTPCRMSFGRFGRTYCLHLHRDTFIQVDAAVTGTSKCVVYTQKD